MFTSLDLQDTFVSFQILPYCNTLLASSSKLALSLNVMNHVYLCCYFSQITTLSTQTVMFWDPDGEWRYPTSLTHAQASLTQLKEHTAVSNKALQYFVPEFMSQMIMFTIQSVEAYILNVSVLE